MCTHIGPGKVVPRYLHLIGQRCRDFIVAPKTILGFCLYHYSNNLHNKLIYIILSIFFVEKYLDKSQKFQWSLKGRQAGGICCPEG